MDEPVDAAVAVAVEGAKKRLHGEVAVAVPDCPPEGAAALPEQSL